jgi:signal transduction histidine kinase
MASRLALAFAAVALLAVACLGLLTWATTGTHGARLEQIIRNLLGNAFKFTPARGTVGVSVAVVGGEVRLSVEDTGPGIPDDELPHLFEPFWRGRAARRTPGSGVGLAVVAELLRAHGGRVEAANRPGGGARLTVSLPRA